MSPVPILYMASHQTQSIISFIFFFCLLWIKCCANKVIGNTTNGISINFTALFGFYASRQYIAGRLAVGRQTENLACGHARFVISISWNLSVFCQKEIEEIIELCSLWEDDARSDDVQRVGRIYGCGIDWQSMFYFGFLE